jgi:hypothetical protein
MKEAFILVLRNTVPTARYEDAVGDHISVGDFVWLKEKQRFKGGDFRVKVMMSFQSAGK